MTTLNYTPFVNGPTLDFLTIISETEKAVQIKSDDYYLKTGKDISIWIPKSAVEYYSTTIGTEERKYVTISNWFRKSLKINKKYIALKVLGLLAI